MSVLGYLPHRCHECGHRFLFNPFTASSGSGPNSTEREIRRTRAAVKWRRRKREIAVVCMAALIFFGFLYYIVTRNP
jgi:hypothetical protein